MTSSSSISESVDKAAEWASGTGKELGGVIAAAGIGTAAKVWRRSLVEASLFHREQSHIYHWQVVDKHGRPFDIEGSDAVMKVNVRGTVDLVRQVLPHLCRATPRPPDGERGVVVMVASVAAFDGQPGQVAYAASKGAIASLTLPMTRDVAEHGIRVVSIAPGPFKTGMTAQLTETIWKSLMKAAEFPRRPGDAAEFAALVRHVIENGMLNGEVIRLDGGMRMTSKI